MKQAVGLEGDQKLDCPLATFPLTVTQLTSVVTLALSDAIDDAGCRDGLSMTVLSWMYRNHRRAPNVGYCRFGALSGRTANSNSNGGRSQSQAARSTEGSFQGIHTRVQRRLWR